MGAALIVAGLVFVRYLWDDYRRAATMDSWVETPCRIVSSGIDDSELTQRGMTKYILEVEYRYEFEGERYLGDRVRRLPTESGHAKKIRNKLEKYPVGRETRCWVDPDDPASAVLKKESKAALYSIWFPGLFILGGAGMVLSAIFRHSR